MLKSKILKISGIIVAVFLGLMLVAASIYLYLHYPCKAAPFEISTDNATMNILIILIINSLIIQLNENVDRLIAQTNNPEKVLVLVTSGGADWRPKSDFRAEAITSVSRKAYTIDLVRLIMDWVGQDCADKWGPDGNLLVLI